MASTFVMIIMKAIRVVHIDECGPVSPVIEERIQNPINNYLPVSYLKQQRSLNDMGTETFRYFRSGEVFSINTCIRSC